MKRFIYQYKMFCSVILLAISPYTIAHEAKDNSCGGYDRNVTQELELLSHDVNEMPTSLNIGKAYQIQLKPQTDIMMLAEPHRISLDDASFAVILPLEIPKTGDYRISVSAESWVDIVKKVDKNNAYEVVSSSDFNGRFECITLRKLVEYHLTENEHYFVQISGATSSNIKLLVTPISK